MPKLYEKTCAWCDRPFATYHNKTACCGHACGGALRDHKHGRTWKPEEEQKLTDLAGTKVFPELVSTFQDWQRSQGLKVRSRAAIASKIFLMGLSQKAVMDDMTISQFARTLGVPVHRALYWRDAYGLPVKKLGRTLCAIALSDFQSWARNNASLLGGLDAERLEWVLGDRVFALYCASLPACRQRVPVKRLDTGESFPDLSKAARSAFLHPNTLQHWAAKSDRFVSGGIQWEVLR